MVGYFRRFERNNLRSVRSTQREYFLYGTPSNPSVVLIWQQTHTPHHRHGLPPCSRFTRYSAGSFVDGVASVPQSIQYKNMPNIVRTVTKIVPCDPTTHVTSHQSAVSPTSRLVWPCFLL